MPIINSLISAGKNPTGTKTITTNGVVDISDYANADVQVPTTAPAHYIEKAVDANGVLKPGNTMMDFSDVLDIAYCGLYAAFYDNQFSGSVVFNDLIHISGEYACTNAFAQSAIAEVNFPCLISISNSNACANMFKGCSYLTKISLPSLTTINGGGQQHCLNMFEDCTSLTSVDLSSLTTISELRSCQAMFSNCTSLTSVNLSSLTTVSGNTSCNSMFSNCSSLTSIDLSSLTTVSGDSGCSSMFSGCTSLTSVNLSSLTTVSGQEACRGMFIGCNLTSLYLPSLIRMDDSNSRKLSLSQIGGANCPIIDLRNLQYAGDHSIDSICYTNSSLSVLNLNALEYIGTEAARTLIYLATPSSILSEIRFPMLTTFGTNPFYSNAFYGRNNLTIHFRKDAQATVEALANYNTLWGAGTGSSAVFDLVGTLTGTDGYNYIRSEKDSVYASETAGAAKIATAWEYNNIIYYTIGGSEPQVGDTIYSDSACTTAITTIDSIA